MFNYFAQVAPQHHHRHHHHHHHGHVGYRPRHRYEQSMMHPMLMDGRNHRAQRRTGGRTHRTKPLDIYGDMLRSHNYHRARHCAPPLVISQRLNRIAQSYAEQLAATSVFEHSGNKLGDKALGENLYMEWISHGRAKIDIDKCISSWYDEVSMHNFQRPKFSKETGHFTQMVWKDTKSMGVGVAHSPDGREVYIVTNYYPAGNIVSRGYFEENVLPPNC